MNHPGEINPLSRMARPHAALITTVEPVHLAFFRNLMEIAEAKAEVFAGLEVGGIAVLNRDNDFSTFSNRPRNGATLPGSLASAAIPRPRPACSNSGPTIRARRCGPR